MSSTKAKARTQGQPSEIGPNLERARRLNWREPRAELDGLSAVEWLKQNYPGRLARELAADLGTRLGLPIAVANLQSAMLRAGIVLTLDERRAVLARRSNGLDLRRWDNPPRIEGNALVLFDLQIPCQDDDFLEKCLGLAKVWGINQLVLGGDALDMGAFAIFEEAAARDAEGEFAEAEQWFARFDRQFDQILWLMGNHEQRLTRWLSGKVSLSRIARMVTTSGKVQSSDYYFCHVNDDWQLEHPRNISVIAGRVPYFLSSKYGRHIASGHGHLWGSTIDVSGERMAIDVGMCADPMKLDYVSNRHSTRPAMVRGALILRNGFPHHLHPRFTDWKLLMSLKAR